MKLEDFIPGECYSLDRDLFIIDKITKTKDSYEKDYYEIDVKERISNKIDADTSGYIIAFGQLASLDNLDELEPFNKETYYKIRKLIFINTNTINNLINK